MRVRHRYQLVILLHLAGISTIQADNWPRFRGVNGSGIGTANVPVSFTKKDYNWKISLPGIGHSSPVVWGNKIFVTCGEEKTGERILLCINSEKGETIWKRSFKGTIDRKHRDNSFASATPALDEKHVYVCWGNSKEYLVIALDHDGKEIWRRDLGGFKGGHGFGASPITHENLVIIPNDHNGESALFALDTSNGKTRWKVPRKSKASYSTPCIYQPKGKPAQIVFTNYEHGVTSVDPKTGKVNWEMDVFYKEHLETAIGSPIVSSDLVFATCGWMGVHQEVIAVQPPEKSVLKPKRLYEVDRSAPLCTTPLVVGDLLISWSDSGRVNCVDVKTGKSRWQQRVRGSYYASPVCIGNCVYNVSRTGEVVVIAASKEFKQLALNRLEEGTHSTPAIANGRMYLRTFRHLISIGGGNTK